MDCIPEGIQVKQKTCKGCREKFAPNKPFSIVCSPCCALVFAVSKREKAVKALKAKDRRETKVKLERIKTIPDLIKEAQIAFNAYIRLRDRAQPCICCGQPLGANEVGGLYDCGHFRSVGSASHLRFNEDNAHAQRKYCNRHGAGRAVDYRIGLIARIGMDRVEALESSNAVHKWRHDELRAIKAHYAQLVRGMKA